MLRADATSKALEQFTLEIPVLDKNVPSYMISLQHDGVQTQGKIGESHGKT
jgi:hypothetical protein